MACIAGINHVIKQAVEIAREQGIPVAIMTFNPHPREVLGQQRYSRYLTPIHDKMQIFASLGVDYTYIVTFDRAFSQIRPDQFVKHMLIPLNPHTVVVGFDFTYGYKGEGTANMLQQHAGHAFDVNVVSPYHMDGEKVSSTLIREQLHIGRLNRIKDYLGRYYSVKGIVVHGDGRGKKIGFPTANLEVTAPYVVPRNGVYAVKVTVSEQTYLGVMNIGTRPTFLKEGSNTSLEVHLLDFDSNLYGQLIEVEFVSFVRKEERFSSVEQLVEQIDSDIRTAQRLLSSL